MPVLKAVRWLTVLVVAACFALGLLIGILQSDYWGRENFKGMDCPPVTNGTSQMVLEPIESDRSLTMTVSATAELHGPKLAEPSPPIDSRLFGLARCLGLDAGSLDTMTWTDGDLKAQGGPSSITSIDGAEPSTKYDDLVLWYRATGLGLSLKACRSNTEPDSCQKTLERTLQLKLPPSWQLVESSVKPTAVEVQGTQTVATWKTVTGTELRVNIDVPERDLWKLKVSDYWILTLGLWPGAWIRTYQADKLASIVAMAATAGFLSFLGGQKRGRRLAVGAWCLAGAFVSTIILSGTLLLQPGTDVDYALRFALDGLSWGLLNVFLLYASVSPQTFRSGKHKRIIGGFAILGLLPASLLLIADPANNVSPVGTLMSAAVGVSLALLIGSAAYRTLRLISVVPMLAPDRATWWSRKRVERGLFVVITSLAAMSLAAPLSGEAKFGVGVPALLSSVESTGTTFARVYLVLGPILVIGVLAIQFQRSKGWRFLGFFGRRRRLVCLLFAISVATPTQLILNSFQWPGWVLTLFALLWITRRSALEPAAKSPGELLDQASVAITRKRSLVSTLQTGPTTETEASGRRSQLREILGDQDGNDAAKLFLLCGPRSDWSSNARFGAMLGLRVGALPVAFFAYTAIWTLGDRSGNYFSTDILLVVLSVILNAIFWGVGGFAFAGLYAWLPGGIGPIKAIALWLAWLGSALAAELITAWPWRPDPSGWLYLALESLLGLVVIAIFYDFGSVRAANGHWRQLLELYNIYRLRDLAAYLIPLVLAIAGLAQQIAAGSASDIVEAALKGLSDALNVKSG